MTAYSASKAAVRKLARTWAEDRVLKLYGEDIPNDG